MRKIILSICAILSSAFIYAQEDCLSFYPSTKGSILINKTYNANDDLLNIITYTIEEANRNVDGESLVIGCNITDAKGSVINKGKFEAVCMNGSVFLKMRNVAVASDFFDTSNIEPGEYMIESKGENMEDMTVRVYDRQYQQKERITTPAGNFEASKITFMFESKTDDELQTHKGVEWYAEGAGIVRSETYDKSGKLESYTVLTNLQAK